MILSDEKSPREAIWQLVESCGYTADLPAWDELSSGSSPVLDLGCGIGRVARHLARAGRQVIGVDLDPRLTGELNRLSETESVEAVAGDVTRLAGLDLGRDRFETIFAPQQLLHILGGEPARCDLLKGVRDRLGPEGIAAFAISEWVPDVSRSVDVLPDVREIGGWVYASRPVEVESDPESLTVVRLRQVVGPDGSFEESEDRISLYRIDRHSLADELEAAGLVALRAIEIPETDRHIGSVIVVAGHDAAAR
ncbi:MAG: class I SAM-dependent methyltransferase [Thermoleophilales bacterium]|nr:class I SAM-dependent methyltransferase [Thermoleophilales bacterium]